VSRDAPQGQLLGEHRTCCVEPTRAANDPLSGNAAELAGSTPSRPQLGTSLWCELPEVRRS
jgi:hypothetical protein